MELVILAAGMGSRFGGLKQMEPMDEYGNFIIDYSIFDAVEAGFDSVTFIIKHEFEKAFKETIGKRVENHIKVKYAYQQLDNLPNGYMCPEGRQKPWGTAHAIFCAKDCIEGDFIIINADDYYGKDAFKVAANYLRSLKTSDRGAYANVAYHVANTITENGSVKRGVCFNDDNGYLTKMVESSIKREANGIILAKPLDEKLEAMEIADDKLVSMNMFVFTHEILAHLENRFPAFLNSLNDPLKDEYLIPSVVTDVVNDGLASVKLLSTTAVWYGVTYKEDKVGVVSALKELRNQGKYPQKLWNE